MMNREDIKRLLPHREPFLFVDEVTEIGEDRIEAYRDIRPDEFYFPGHFPGFPVLPGVLMVEAIAQAGILVVLAREESRDGRKTLFAAIERVRFRRPVRPGERLLLSARILGGRAGVYRIAGEARVGEELACEAVVTGALRE
ncbi:MAG TPA: 3-hydroxyacyl-ACP dehydratase FabZ [candidate division WOR-3 bacterium]|uniref:3-hydroxyacyl-[acyl-carrier-protein] dehydratase n=1 Tax=candidate division WOR-3 bacterium TaxID=2052148 RepID=A0A7V0T7H1_UNCW3|nr:3-hydroxyacyl-ACP dehydratase FabZ [candidate division WOR-3 bacterium]